MIKRIIGLTILLLAGIMIGSLRGQESAPEQEELKLPAPPHELCHKDFVRFWRLTLDGHAGDWHNYNKSEDRFLREMQVRIYKGEYTDSKLEWFALEGKLPK